MQSAIEEFAHKPGAGRSRGGDREAEEEEEEGGGDEADRKSNNPHPTDTQQGRCQRGCFEMSWWGSVEVKQLFSKENECSRKGFGLRKVVLVCSLLGGAMDHGRRHAVRFKSTDDLTKAPKPSNAFDPRSEVQFFPPWEDLIDLALPRPIVDLHTSLL